MQRWTWLIVFVAFFAVGMGRFRPRAVEQDSERLNSAPAAGAIQDSNDRVSTSDYDPLRALSSEKGTVYDDSVKDRARNREVPVRIYLPAKSAGPVPVVLFSHGLGGSREGSTFLGQHWSKRGYVAVFLQHPGSDESVWKNESLGGRRRALVQAANGEQLALRTGDVSAVLDQLERWNAEPGHQFHQRVDLKRVGMSGHSFGAVTTQNVSGQSNVLGRSSLEPRIRAAVVMSPGVPAIGNAERAFRSVKIPWLLLTGTHDDSPIGEQSPESRREVFPALPPGDKYELVLNQAEHSVFTDYKLPGETKGRNPSHHRAIEAISTAFWDAYLREDAAAKAWLQSDEVKSVLDQADQWQRK